MKQQYRDINLRPDTLKLIEFLNSMIDDYMAQGFTLSVRQLYYQLVARAVIENTERSYKRVASIINDGRLAGLIDWDAIEDRGRDIVKRASWESGSSILRSCADQYHMDMWENQPHRVFVIVEKAALAGVLDGVCHKLDVPLLAARGYPSVSVVRELALDHLESAIDSGQHPVVLHLGDHDPSGIDMTRDLEDRFQMFMPHYDLTNDWTLERIALTMDQIDEHAPPPNPAKTTDSRFADYRRNFGDESWELDALEPRMLVKLVAGHVEHYRDPDRWHSRQDEIDKVKRRLDKSAKQFEKEGL